MGSLREASTAKTQLLEPMLVVGRAPTCALRLSPRYVSAQHASLRWTGHCWELKDLGSRNGTFLDGKRISPGEEHATRSGSRIAFGNLQDQWELVDESPPQVMAVPVEGGEPVLLEGDLLALPSADDPRATIYRGAAGSWILEQPDESSCAIANLQVFQSVGRAWRFCCTEEVSPTSRFAFSALEMVIRQVGLSFSVSRDEEYVHLDMACAGRTVDMGARAHNFLLLTLARRRLEDAAQKLPETTCGWIYQEDLSRDASMAPPNLNIDVFRIRRQFAALGIVDAANIIERRPVTRQLRIGTGHLTVATL